MAGAIGPGDFVECIDSDGPDPLFGPRAYSTGELCVVEEVGEAWFGPWLNCVGKIRPADVGSPKQAGFHIQFFRPIYRPRASFIESLKAPPQPAPREREGV